MTFLYRAFAVCVIYSVLGQWLSVVAVGNLNSSAIHVNLSSAFTHSHMSVSTSYNKSVIIHSMTVTPSNKTVAPSHNMTVAPSHMTVAPSHNMTVTPSHMTVMPHNSTVMPPGNMSITPTSAHTVLPSSTVHPTPTLPPPKPGNFTVKDNNTVCLLANMAAKFDVMTISKKFSIDLVPDAKSSGECDTNSKDKPFITLSWTTRDGQKCKFTMHFVKLPEDTTLKASPQHWAAANLTFSLQEVDASVITFHSGKGPLTGLSARVGDAYECQTAPADFNLTANHSSVDVTLTKFTIQPFGVKHGDFGNVTVCIPPSTSTATPTQPTTNKSPTTEKPESHTVAIAVGCSLAGLALIAIIGYLIWRRRNRKNQAAGYRKL